MSDADDSRRNLEEEESRDKEKIAIMRILVQSDSVALKSAKIAAFFVDELHYTVKKLKKNFYIKKTKEYNAEGLLLHVSNEFISFPEEKQKKYAEFDDTPFLFNICEAFDKHFEKNVAVDPKADEKMQEIQEEGTPWGDVPLDIAMSP